MSDTAGADNVSAKMVQAGLLVFAEWSASGDSSERKLVRMIYHAMTSAKIEEANQALSRDPEYWSRRQALKDKKVDIE